MGLGQRRQAPDDGQNVKRKGKKPVTRFNITIYKKAGGFEGTVSIGGPLLGKKKSYVRGSLEELLPDLEASAMRVFRVRQMQPPMQEDYIPQESPSAAPPAFGDMISCINCGEQVAYGKFCSGCGTKAPAKPKPVVPAPVMVEQSTDVAACTKCGATVPYEKFCQDCGTKAPPKPVLKPKSKFCTDCGSQVDPVKRFCGVCGSAQ